MNNKQLQDLVTCYDAQASHFHNTRWFYKRPELTYIAQILDSQTIASKNKSNSPQLSLLDIGCGTGRIAQRLDQQWYDHICYQGVDISPGMIDQARMHYPDKDFEVIDMSSHLQSVSQQSLDVILCLAAFHHLQTKQERLVALHNMYRTLNYWWVVILVNRSFSHWFLKKYRSSIIQAIIKSIGTLWTSKWNDILVPWKDPDFVTNQEIHHRFYHMFGLQELKKLIRTTDFELLESCYITQDGAKNHNRHDSRNSFVVLRK